MKALSKKTKSEQKSDEKRQTRVAKTEKEKYRGKKAPQYHF